MRKIMIAAAAFAMFVTQASAQHLGGQNTNIHINVGGATAIAKGGNASNFNSNSAYSSSNAKAQGGQGGNGYGGQGGNGYGSYSNYNNYTPCCYYYPQTYDSYYGGKG